MTDRQTDGQMDARGKTICLPTLKGDGQTDGQTDARGKTICLPTLKRGDIKSHASTAHELPDKYMVFCRYNMGVYIVRHSFLCNHSNLHI